MLIFPLIYLVTPFTALIQDTTTRYAVFLAVMLLKGIVVIIGFPCTTILLTNSASSLRILGTLNGFATTVSGIGRAIGPAAAGAVFSWGAKEGYAIAPWWMLAVIAMAGAVVPWWIVEGEGPTRSLGASDDGEAAEGERQALLDRGGESDAEEDAALLDGTGAESESGSELGYGRKNNKKGKSEYGTVDGVSR